MFSCLLVCGGTAGVGLHIIGVCMDADIVVRRNPSDICRVENDQQEVLKRTPVGRHTGDSAVLS